MDQDPRIPNLLKTQTPVLPDLGPSPKTLARRRTLKLLAFDLLSAGSAAALGYACAGYFVGTAGLTTLGIALAAFLIFGFFDFLLSSGFGRRMGLLAIQAVAFLGWFAAGRTPAVLGSAAAALIVFFFIADRAAAAALENGLKFRLWPVARAYMKKIFIGLSLAAIILYVPLWQSDGALIPEGQFTSWYQNFAGFANRFYTNLDFKNSVGSFAQSIARMELSNNDQFKALSAGAQDTAISFAGNALVTSAAKSIGFSLTPDTPLADAFYKYFMSMLEKFRTQLGDSFIAAWAIGVFVIVWSIGTIFVWFVILAAYVFYELFSALSVLHLAGETRTKEVVELV